MIESLESRTLCSSTLFSENGNYRTGLISKVATGDFDGNGTIDIATNNGAVLLNNGPAVFKRPLYSLGATDEPIVAADFNHDGKADVAGSFLRGRFHIFYSRGKGLFHLPVEYAHISGRPIIVDANNDGFADIAISGNGCIQIFQNNRAGGFDIHTHLAPASIRSGVLPGSLAAADFNHDGYPDLFGGAARERTPIYLNDRHGGFSQTALVAAQNYNSVAGDFNGDHKPDLIVGTLLLLGNGDGSFKRGVAILSVFYAVTAAADVNHDGRLDAIFPSTDTLEPRVRVFAGKGNGTFTEIDTFRPHDGTSIGPLSDLNHDGKLDLITFTGSSPFADPFIYDYVNGGVTGHLYDWMGVMLNRS